MSTRVSDATVQAVRERIEDVIEQVVTLRRAGGDSLKGLCPFHDEKSPSFHVRSSAQMWKCFGCQESGDVISFVQKLDGLGFRDAVEHIASQCGIEVTYEQVTSGTSHTVARPAGVSSEHRARLLAVNEAAAAFYRAALVNGVEGSAAARTFLADRGFDRDVAGQYELGYAPAGWTTLVNHLAGAGFTREEMVDAGLVKVSTTSARVYDAFRDRLIFPIRNTSNLLIGFGARKLEETDTGPKYLNTPETILYKKSQVLYGLDRAKATLARDRHAVVVEGYTDVIAMHLSGEIGRASCRERVF